MQYTGSGFVTTDGSLVDFPRGPWSTLQKFFDVIPVNRRTAGQEFLVVSGDTFIEYRLEGGVAIGNAVETGKVQHRGLVIITDANFNVVFLNEVYLGNTSANNIEGVLPDPATVTSVPFTIRKIHADNSFALWRTTGKIVFDGIEYDIIELTGKGQWAILKSNGTNYYVVADSGLTATNFDDFV